MQVESNHGAIKAKSSVYVHTINNIYKKETPGSMHTVIIAKPLGEPFYYNTLNYSNQFVDSPREKYQIRKKM